MIHLRPLALSDVDAVLAGVAISHGELAPWMSWCHPAYSRTDASEWATRATADRAAGAAAHFVIADEQHSFLGVLGIEDITADSDVAVIGYWVATPHAGRGVAPNAIRSATAWTFAETHVTELLAFIAPANTRSRRAVEKAGFALREPYPLRGPPTGQLTYSLRASARELKSLLEGVHPVRIEDGARLLEVWEASVRATHHFLAEEDIQFFKGLVLEALFSLPSLACVRDAVGQVVGFVGTDAEKMEALFVHPSWHRTGIGRRLTKHAVEQLGATTVDVNEQNDQAVAFYARLGFEVEGRSDVDGTGKPFPLLHMRLGDAAMHSPHAFES